MCMGLRSVLVMAVLAATGLPAWGQEVEFLKDVRPILANNCFVCHGPDEGSREGDLRLDLPATGDESNHVIVAGDPQKSELIARVVSEDPELVMPPIGSGHELTEQQIDILKRWIQQGAEYQLHWAFVPPTRPALPDSAKSDSSVHPIDAFVDQQLQQHGLQRNPAADPYTLIRRLSLDLTGLPPTVEAADRFAADPSDAAWEALVDELLQSPAFGEHWASLWLDLARYADTKGYEKDQPREIWRYRDWVINAFNDDMPFDQFTREQLAGDLLPNPTTDQLLATAFHRNTMTNDEGGTDNEEFRIAAVKDRVDTTVQVWMGLTMGCAKCHSHKYDPISQHDYYRFLAYFNQTEDADRSDDAPRIATPTPAQSEQQQQLQQKVNALKSEYMQTDAGFTAALDEWQKGLRDNPNWYRLQPVAASSVGNAAFQVLPDLSILAADASTEADDYRVVLQAADELPTSKPITAIRLEALTHEKLPKNGPGRNPADTNFVLSELRVTVVGEGAADGDAPDEAADDAVAVPLQNARADFSQNGWDVTKSIDGNTATGWAISPQQGQPHVAVFDLKEPLVLAAGQKLQIELVQQYQATSLLLGCIRFSASTQAPDSLLPELQSASELAVIPADQRTKEQQAQLESAFRRIYPATAQTYQNLKAAEEELAALNRSIPRTPIMKDLATARHRQTFVHVRGNFLEHGDEVSAGLPTALGPVPESADDNRLKVAEWLLSDKNPLTARVTVNRVWARLFGTGLVATEEDFGLQGSLPSHPELLDWLAVEFRDTHAWSLKQLCRSIVMSSTYRQAADVSEQKSQTDPAGRLLSRSPRVRLTAETVRDQALAAAGLLSRKMGGPSVMPPQPPGIWRTTYSSLKWETATGEDRYRRGLYTFWRRTSPYPSMITFDAGSREVCQIRRIRTNTPLQALVTMNDPVFVEAAGGLAATAEGLNTEDGISAMFRRVLTRFAEPAELNRLVEMHKQAASQFQSNTDAAKQLLKAAAVETDADPAEAAARVVVANVLLNLDETLTRP